MIGSPPPRRRWRRFGRLVLIGIAAVLAMPLALAALAAGLAGERR